MKRTLCWKKARALNESVGDHWGLGSAYRGLGIVAQALGQYQEANHHDQKSPDDQYCSTNFLKGISLQDILLLCHSTFLSFLFGSTPR